MKMWKIHYVALEQKTVKTPRSNMKGLFRLF